MSTFEWDLRCMCRTPGRQHVGQNNSGAEVLLEPGVDHGQGPI